METEHSTFVLEIGEGAAERSGLGKIFSPSLKVEMVVFCDGKTGAQIEACSETEMEN